MIKNDWDGYGAKYEAKFAIISRNMLSGGQNIIFCKILCIFPNLHSLSDSAKNSVGAESQNHRGTDISGSGHLCV